MSPHMQALMVVEHALDEVPRANLLRFVPAAQHLTDEHWERLAALASGGRDGQRQAEALAGELVAQFAPLVEASE